MNKFFIATAVIALGTAAVAQEETTMTMEEVPAAVMDAAIAANTMGTEFESVAMDDGVYEFAGTGADGMGYEVDVMEDGSIEEVEMEIMMEAVPAEVSAALEAEMPGFEPTYIEESTRPEGVIVYEFEGEFDGQTIDAEINADGTGFMMNEDAAG